MVIINVKMEKTNRRRRRDLCNNGQNADDRDKRSDFFLVETNHLDNHIINDTYVINHHHVYVYADFVMYKIIHTSVKLLLQFLFIMQNWQSASNQTGINI